MWILQQAVGVFEVLGPSAFRAGPVAAGFYFDKINHDLTPGALDKTFIRGRQICFGDLEVDGWLFSSLVFRVQKPGGGHPVTGVQTFLFAGQFVVKVIPSAILATVESEFLFHSCFIYSDDVTTEDFDLGREQPEVTQNLPELNFAGTSAGTFASNFRKSLMFSHQRAVAGGGIGRFIVRFQAQKYDISPMNASTFALLLTFTNELINYPLTEGFLAHARM